MGKAGPRRAPTRSGVSASEHRHRAHPRRLQLAGHREGGEQGHKARLLHWPAAAADVDCDAGLSKGFAAAGIDVQEHLADWAAEGGGGHGWMAKNTDPAPRRRGRARASPQRGRQRRNRRGLACVSPGAAVVVRALLVEGLARPVAESGYCCFRLRGCCSPVSCLLRPAVHAAGPPWLSAKGAAPDDPAGITANGRSASRRGGFGVLGAVGALSARGTVR